MIIDHWHHTLSFASSITMLHGSALSFPKVFLPPHTLLSSHFQHRSVHACADSSSASSPPTKQYPWLLVGVGNPGKKYEGTRHNIGFEMIDAFAKVEGIKLNTIQHKALTGKGKIGSAHVLLAKPQTYVNLIGESVGPLAAYYRIPVQHILVIFDDMSLEFGLLRVHRKGGPANHNGLKSLMEHLKRSRDFPRIRIGIGTPPGTMDEAVFVLQKFSEPEREEMNRLIPRGIDAIRQVITEGIDEAASFWNEVQKSRLHLTDKETDLLRSLQ